MKQTDKFKQLEKEIKPYKTLMSEASDTILDQGISLYPIFIVHQQEIDMGLPLLESFKEYGIWKVHASTLEEFVTKQLIDIDKMNGFIKIFKDPEAHLCLFVVSELGAKFIFTSRK